MNGFEAELKTRILGTVPNAIISNEDNALSDWQQQIPQLLKIERVQSVEPVVRGEAIIQAADALQGVLFEGIVPQMHASNVLRANIYTGRLTDLKAGSYRIIIGESLARELNVGVGDKVRIISARGSRFTPLGRMPQSA